MPPSGNELGKHHEGEFGLITWIRKQAGKGQRTILGIGDDCAVLRFPPSTDVLVTTDMLMEGRHFDLGKTRPYDVGYKALAVNLSDIAAMAGVPLAALVAVALPRKTAVELTQGILEGMLPLAERFGVDLVGGDTNAWDGPLVISVTLIGATLAPGPIKRSGARPGDAILVTGPLGGSLLGRHMKPQPRVAEALALLRSGTPRAMIDISDGLSSDLAHILEESGGLGAILDASSIPIHPEAVAASKKDGRSVLDHALNDGEDFELCFVCETDMGDRLVENPPVPAGIPGLVQKAGRGNIVALDEGKPMTLSRIGQVTREPGLWLRGTDGTVISLQSRGFDHLAASQE